MKIAQIKDISPNAYTPSKVLVKHLQKRLQLEEKRKKLTSAGEELSAQEKKERTTLIRRKVDVLNNHVFQSMANITTFLEYCMGPTLGEIFEDDIEELLLGTNSDKGLAKSKKQPLLMTEYWNQPVLTRLLNAIMTWNYTEDKNNFRLKIFSIMQRVIGRYIMAATQQILADDDDPSLSSTQGVLANEKFHEIVNNELARLIVFTELLAKNAEIKNNNPSRPVLF
jgi:hypothetical protein